MSKILQNTTEATIGPVVHEGSRVVFDPGEVKTVADDFPETEGLEEISAEEAAEAKEAAVADLGDSAGGDAAGEPVTNPKPKKRRGKKS